MRSRSVAVVAATALLLGGPLLVPPLAWNDEPNHRALADADSRFATLAGVDVHHKVAGEDGPGVVLLHHFYGNVATWRHVLAGLSTDARVAAFDRPAFGLTERRARADWVDGSNPYTRATSARITLELMDELGMDEAVLVGSSAGGTAALEAYAMAPERVRGLVLLSPAITGDVGAPPQLRSFLGAPQFRQLAPRLIARMAGEITLERVARSWADPSRATADDVAAYSRPLGVDGWETALYELFVAEPPPDLRSLLPRIDVPTLVVSGDRDRVISSTWNRRTADAIPDARYVELEDCGHTPQEECPDQLVAVIREFLAGI